jgi:hypothetical protein
MRAAAGDRLTVKGRRQGDGDRHGTIIEVHGTDGTPPCLVHWRDDYESMFFPAREAVVERHPAVGVADAVRGSEVR